MIHLPRRSSFLPAFCLIFAFIATACHTPHHDEPHVQQSPRQSETAPEPVQNDEMEALPVDDDPMVSINTLHPAPEDYALQRIDTEEYPIPSYAKYLKGVRICLNPGHGGDAHKRGFKRGPTGVREAEMNLRVAKYLRDLLAHAGAEVIITRESDIELTYEERATIAAEWNADLFVSCHHNAIGNKPKVNRTTVWYHADVDYRPANLDLARHLCRGLMQAFGFEQVSSIPLHSDQLMYKNGFAVLRHAKGTAALCESSFFTNPEEEQRLRDPAHNLREAYGMFLGLAWYAYGGIPRATLIEPEDGVLSSEATQLVFELDDGLRSRRSWGHERSMVIADSIAVRIDGQRLPHSFTNEGYVLTAELPDELAAGAHDVTVHFSNMFKNTVINPDFAVTVE